MKSKLTLRLDDDLKERAKQLADERGISVSRLVEDYFRLLIRACRTRPASDSTR
jgi:antitoxin component of RelBE/YafQ-DinJ toxin-antitoxin module